MSIYLLKDISRLSGLSTYTVKYYLRLGLIKEIGRSPATGFRYFNNDTLEDLEQIKKYRRDKISINKIKDLMQK